MFKLISVNIEHDKHVSQVMRFLEKEKPDVLYLQEVLEENFFAIKDLTSLDGIFEPYLLIPSQSGEENFKKSGCALLSRLPLAEVKIEYYHDERGHMPVFGTLPTEELPTVLISASVSMDDKSYTFATTHFTWTPDGKATSEQREKVEQLLALLKSKENLILAGDFNAPRGGEIFGRIAEHYRDNIPKEYTTSIDKDLHRRGDLQLMVDGLFSTENIEFEKVKLVSGVSDHMAIVAEVK